MLLVNAIQICSVVLETMKEPPAWEMLTLSHKPFRDPGYKLVGGNKNPLHTFGKLLCSSVFLTVHKPKKTLALDCAIYYIKAFSVH